MLTPRPEDRIHKTWLLRLLTAFADDHDLSAVLWFKGGTCAALRGMIDRFSVDLDFDARLSPAEIPTIRKNFEVRFKELGLSIKDASKSGIQYFLRYPAPIDQRNTIKIDTLIPPPASNEYEAVTLLEIDRTLRCQTQETMVANKMVAMIDRFEKTKAIAGRDLYDLHEFFLKGLSYRREIIEERRECSAKDFLNQLMEFIDRRITTTIIDQDLNLLLPQEEFRRIRKVLKQETLMLLRDEMQKFSS